MHWTRLIAILTLGGVAGIADAQTGDQCRAVTMPDGSSARMCRNADGTWRSVAAEPAATPASTGIPAQAEITYAGTYRFVEGPKPRPARAPRVPNRLSLNTLLNAAMSAPATPKGTEYQGALTIKATFDGQSVTAQVTGTGGIAQHNLSGLIANGVCRLADARGAVVFEGKCTSNEFSGVISGTDNYRLSLNGNFSAAATKFVDVADRNARAAADKRVAAAAAAERKAEIDAKRAKLKPLCDAGKVTACVEMDTLE
ncbi:hypothetical protein NYR55_00960 [Sphingomonas sp. BGYR3]|uniref:hypothetical protein n=1 Tax=Sphingomonas sp. BGYR3 TaxID=2975483 RepID=UPI0021A6A86C|nr:hypothetical protein [Sphingomonas sp. BGYR3]MDG5487199.1 hypothetical protein [Sphingomonas sp. BGYR3]